MAKIIVESLTYDIGFEINEKELKELEEALKDVDKAVLELGKEANKQLDSMDQDIEKLARDAERALGEIDKDFNEVEKSIEDMDDAAKDLDLDEELKRSATEAKKLDDELDKTKKGVQGVDDTVKKLTLFQVFQEIGQQLAQLGEQLIQFQKDSFVTFKDFDRSIKFAQVTFDITDDQIAEARKEVERLGRTTEKNALEISSALNFIALAGFDVNESLKILPKTIDLSIVAGQDLASTTDLLTDSISALGIDLDNLDGFINSSIKTTQKSNTSLSQLFEAYLAVGKLAKDSGISINELQTFIGQLANNGIKGAEAGVKFRNIILSLTNPTNEAADLMKELNLRVADSEGNFRSFEDIISDVKTSMDGMTEAERNVALGTLFNKQDVKAINALLDNTGDGFNNLRDEIINSTGAAEKAVGLLKDTSAGDLESLKSAVEGTKISIGKSSEGIFRPLIKEATDLLTIFNDTSGGFKEFVAILSVVAGAIFKALPAVIALGAAIVLMGTGLLWVVAIIAAVIAIVTAVIWVIKHWSDIIGFLQDKFGGVLEAIRPFTSAIAALAKLLWDSAIVTVKILIGLFKILQPILEILWGLFKIIGQIVLAVFVVALDALGIAIHVVVGIFEFFIDVLKSVMDFIEPVVDAVSNAIGKVGEFLNKFDLFKNEASELEDFELQGEITRRSVSTAENPLVAAGAEDPVVRRTSSVNNPNLVFAPQIDYKATEGMSKQELERLMDDQQEKYWANAADKLETGFAN